MPHHLTSRNLGRTARCRSALHPARQPSTERLHRASRTLHYAWLASNLFDDIEQVQHISTRCFWTYNHERPNMGLGGTTPMHKLALAAWLHFWRPREAGITTGSVPTPVTDRPIMSPGRKGSATRRTDNRHIRLCSDQDRPLMASTNDLLPSRSPRSSFPFNICNAEARTFK